jgi:dGTPase
MQQYNASLFEGNAQSFRIVTRLEPKAFGPTADGGSERPLGLDLTRATLRALSKYPYSENDADRTARFPKFGVYDDPEDSQYFDWVWQGDKHDKNLAARIMDVADDIAYAVHDFEDGVWSGMIPIRDLLDDDTGLSLDLEEKVLDRDGKDQLFADGDVAKTLQSLFGASWKLSYIRKVGFDRTREARAELKNFTAALIGELIGAVTADGEFSEPTGDPEKMINVLKAMAFLWMIERTETETHQYGQRRLVERLFDGYWSRPEMLPRREEWIDVEASSVAVLGESLKWRWPEKARLICDHVAGMTDGYAREVYDQMHRATQRRDLRLTY